METQLFIFLVRYGHEKFAFVLFLMQLLVGLYVSFSCFSGVFVPGDMGG